MDTGNLIIDKSYTFALELIVVLRDVNCSQGPLKILIPQLIRSATSVGANIQEAHNAQSKKDFIHKMYIAQKECAESAYWLRLFKDSELMNHPDSNNLILKAEELLRIIRSITLTAKRRLRIGQ
jgi:four helix bundle protein